MRSILAFLGWLTLCSVAAGLGAFASASAAQFYMQLTQPSWAPPAWVFGPVWTTLYLLMSIAVWLVWREESKRGKRTGQMIFIAQLVLNALWTWLFFTWRLGLLASIEIVLLEALILATIAVFWRIHRVAAVLLVPYALWVGFATALTVTLWRLNPELLG